MCAKMGTLSIHELYRKSLVLAARLHEVYHQEQANFVDPSVLMYQRPFQPPVALEFAP